MQSTRSWISGLLAACLALSVGTARATETEDNGNKLRLAQGRGVPDRYIVVLNEEASDRGGRAELTKRVLAARGEEIASLAGAHRVPVGEIWLRALTGFSARLTLAEARALAADPRVLVVEQVAELETSQTASFPDCQTGTSAPAGLPVISGADQQINCSNPVPGGTTCQDNWGLDRIDQQDVGGSTPPALSGTYALPTAGATVHAYVLDSGATTHHQEFLTSTGASRLGLGVNLNVDPLDPRANDVTDRNGHGTHVSAILGGRAYGAAKNVILHPVRVVADGVVTTERLLSGFEWILERHPAGEPAVASMSLNSTAFPGSTSLALGARRLIQAGVSIVESAGNHNQQASFYTLTGGLFPSEILIVGGSDRFDRRWVRPPGDPLCSSSNPNNCGSNFGSEIDLFAPAENILSAWAAPGSKACFLTGTSMAAPHAAGVAANLLALFPKASPGTVEKALKRIATENRLDPATLAGSANRLLYSVFPAGALPVAGGRLYETPAGQPLHISRAELLAGDIEWAGGGLQLSSVGVPKYGTAAIVGSEIVYEPPMGYIGEDSFSYIIQQSGPSLGLFDTGFVRIQVGTISAPPVALDDLVAVAVNTPTAITATTLLANDLGAGLSFHALASAPLQGTLVSTGSNTWSYTPHNGFTGLDRFDYWVRNAFDQSDLATVHLRVGGPLAGAFVIDSFANVPPLRDQNDPLTGTQTESGGLIWNATAGALFGTGVVTNEQGVNQVVGGVPFQPSSYPTALAARLEVRLNPNGSSLTGAGFSSTAKGGYWGHGQVWAHLNPAGQLVVKANGNTHVLYTSSIPAPGYQAGWNELAIEYTWSDRSVRVWLNGQAQPLSTSKLGTLGFVPDIKFAGIVSAPNAATYPSRGLIGFDDFRLSLQSQSLLPSAPTNVQASDDLYSDRIHITWDPVPGATAYRVYRTFGEPGNELTLLPIPTTTPFYDDRTAHPGPTTYYYAVAAVSSLGTGPASTSDAGRRLNIGLDLRVLSPVSDVTAKQQAPMTNFGNSTELGIRQQQTGLGEFSFLRFDLSGINGTVDSAYLRLKVGTTAIPGVSVFEVNDQYHDESALTWNNWNTCATANFLWKSWDLAAGSTVYLDVTNDLMPPLTGAVVRGDGLLTIGLATDFDVPNLSFLSHEAPNTSGNRPQLVVFTRPNTTRTIRLSPSADARTSQTEPNINFGSDEFLRVRTVDGNPPMGANSFLRFVPPTFSGTVQSATLRLRSQETAIPQTSAYAMVDTNWMENQLTWNTPYTPLALLGSVTNISANTWVDIPLSLAIAPVASASPYVIGITSSQNLPDLDFWSRESVCDPRLEIVVTP